MTNNSIIGQLLLTLGKSYSPNHWADGVEADLARTLDALSDADWRELLALVHHEPAVSRHNFAKALRYQVTDRSTALLVAFLRSGDPLLGLAATQSLYDRYQFWLPDVSIRAELERHSLAAEPAIRLRLEALLPKALC